MPQFGEQRHLAVVGGSSLDNLSWTESAAIDLFDRDQPVLVFAILRLVDHAEASLPDLADDPVALGKKRTRRQAINGCGRGKRSILYNRLHRWRWRPATERLLTSEAKRRIAFVGCSTFGAKEQVGRNHMSCIFLQAHTILTV